MTYPLMQLGIIIGVVVLAAIFLLLLAPALDHSTRGPRRDKRRGGYIR